MSKNPQGTRKSHTSTIGDVLKDLFREYHLQDKFDEVRLVSSWEKIVGKPIATRTGKIYIKNKILYVEVLSAPLKHELNLSKGKLMTLFENEVGKGIVDHILFF